MNKYLLRIYWDLGIFRRRYKLAALDTEQYDKIGFVKITKMLYTYHSNKYLNNLLHDTVLEFNSDEEAMLWFELNGYSSDDK